MNDLPIRDSLLDYYYFFLICLQYSVTSFTQSPRKLHKRGLYWVHGTAKQLYLLKL